jgi:NAD(P)-dependent dehydrogenase (short-subunit alcohol dehydrogenase family)
MIAIRGYSSSLAQALLPLLPEDECAVPVERGATNTAAHRHLFAQGVIHAKPMAQMTDGEKLDSWNANAGMTIAQCNLILATNEEARICVIGSESANSWSFDDCYAASKAALHRYVETKKLKPRQQLICVAPTIIEDSRMTRARVDLENLGRRRDSHPKKRFLSMLEVVRMVHFVLYVDRGYTTGTVIRMNGGMHTQ